MERTRPRRSPTAKPPVPPTMRQSPYEAALSYDTLEARIETTLDRADAWLASVGEAAPPAGSAHQGAQTLELSVVIPCLNEADTVGRVVAKAKSALESLGIPGEVIVADNGSSDGSQHLAEQAGARVVHVPQRGYGSALMGGIQAAHGRFVLMGDADDSYDFTQLEPFYQQLVDGKDLGGSTARRGAVLYRVADGSEGANFAFTLGSGVTSAVGDIVAFSGVNATGGFKADGTAGGPFDVDPGAISLANSATVNATSITTNSANAAVVMLGMAANSTGSAPHGTMPTGRRLPPARSRSCSTIRAPTHRLARHG